MPLLSAVSTVLCPLLGRGSLLVEHKLRTQKAHASHSLISRRWNSQPKGDSLTMGSKLREADAQNRWLAHTCMLHLWLVHMRLVL
jgi:hypothetical protein